ncbi:FtsK-like domain-containing protein [Aquisphaera giovannonii]|uniref:FtsK-like domain-containing protein n=1 Tax=Aquisphaera giovannonii TaxID=406548 RepID=A0A5B9W8Z0_9BACT|nr:FtsK/SpoIIIE domain-containing protein [Aquisphaera giovannonii]QEH37082.1 FtsK-like domain-containing protein [Aquisphaera giovannonii]
MPESPLVRKEIDALNGLEALIAARSKEESETEQVFQRRREREEQEYRASAQKRTSRYKAERSELEAQYNKARDGIGKAADRETQAIKAEYEQALAAIESRLKNERARAKKAMEESGWQALAMYEAARDGAKKTRKADEEALAQSRADFEAVQGAAIPILDRYRKLAGPEPPAATPPASASGIAAGGPSTAPGAADVNATDPGESTKLTTLQDAIKAADEELLTVEKMGLASFLRPQNFFWPFLLLGILAGVGLGLQAGWIVGGVVGVAAALVAGIGSYIGLKKVVRPRLARHYFALQHAVDDAGRLLEQTKEWVKNDYERKMREAEENRERDVNKSRATAQQRSQDAEARYQREKADADTSFPARLDAVAAKRDADMKAADGHYPPRLKAMDEAYEADSAQLQDAFRKAKAETTRLYEEAWANLVRKWSDGLAAAGRLAGEVNEESKRRFMDWEKVPVAEWTPPKEVPPALPFGRFTIDLSDFPRGVPTDPRLKDAGPTHLELPAFIPFPIRSSVLIKAPDSGKYESVRLLQALMLRFLTSVPPGKVRFTIFDPVGLGENFAAFMHLADYHELLVTSRIWTETPHIEQRLTDLQQHMENVIQKYLRNEFETIEEYNAYAGEVAEPFRVLVAANFPAAFNESAARRLASIVSTGARCGVYALISMDPRAQVPAGCNMKEVEANCVNVSWKDGKLGWRDSNFGRFPLQLDAPPDPGTFSQILHVVGEKARDANRVEVPFDFIAPPPEAYWASDSRGGVDVPLGRAGATKLQSMALGKGTSQHALIAGKTGSGKSTLLHALITNAALRYSPDDVELYLIDFKKGVEFKVYASLELPHAKVIAVESEREFGLSVLQRLDLELKRRGDLFRDTGVQDIRGFRDARSDIPMPRILFIVDEFQEFFVEDDKISQEVSLLLDRLVRQGRAFGMHVILGSQTLGGAYSLARATLGQMAVRVALQCSEADAHLILSEDNTAARLLTRPGEAIYNDANGLIEGNNLFQVVWLSDDQREAYLEQIQRLAKARHRRPATPIVFEGNLPAIASKNPLLNPLLDAATWPEPPRYESAWLGDAIAIKDPTAVVFRPQSGSNLLIIGQADEAALAMFLMAAVSIAAQHPPRRKDGIKFYLLDGSPVDSSLSGRLGKLAQLLPHDAKNVSARELPAVMGEVAAEIERRRDVDAEGLSPIYLFIYDIQRFRDLRKGDDDYGFSSSFGEDKSASPSKSFGTILKDGPAVGVHTVVWCDSVNNLNRTFDRTGLREFELRVLFQMSANDSSSLIDSPAAGKLGPNRALFFSEEENKLEKFRPYGLPDPTWLDQVTEQFRSRPVPAESAAGVDGDRVAHGEGNGRPEDHPSAASMTEEVGPTPGA